MSLFNNILFGAGMFNGSPIVGVSSDDDIVFNNYGLQNSNIVTSEFQDENPPQKIYDKQNFPRGNGQIFVGSHQEVKTISLKGILKADSNSEFVTLLKEFRKYFRADNGILKKIEAGELKQYIANLVSLNIPRAAWNTTFAEFEAVFNVFKPYGFSDFRETKTRTITAGTFTEELYHDGNVDEGKLISVFIFDSATNVTELSLTNTATGETIIITESFSAGDLLEINGEKETVQLNGSDVEFTGVIPTLNVGSNPLTGIITSTNHSIISTHKFYNYFS